MNAPGDVVDPYILRIAEDADVSNWLDALADGDCTQDELLDEIRHRELVDSDAGWEALAQLDQLFRRHRIDQDLYKDLKDRLHQSLLPQGTEMSRPAPSISPLMVATRTASLVDIPVITTAVESCALPRPRETPVHRAIQAGDALGKRYRVVDVLRRTALSTVVEAIDELKAELPGVRRRVAIRVMDEAVLREQAWLARIGKIQDLSHPAIARLFDVDEDNGALLLVSELLSGPSLRDLLAGDRGRLLHATLAWTAVSSMASALTYAHSQGVTHGSVSMANVFITQTGDIRLQGFEDTLHAVEPAADRLAFAWLAYELLAGAQAANAARGDGSGLRAPPGLSHKRWRVLRDTLNGKDGAHGNVLAALADNAPDKARVPWAMAACVAAVLGMGAWLIVENGSGISEISAVAAPAAAPAPEPAAAPAPEVAVPSQSTPAVPAVVVPARSRIDLPASTATVDTSARVARIWVRRRDNLNGAVTFQWWTEAGSAAEDRDFRRIPPRTETIPDGASGVEVLVPLIPDSGRHETRSFYVMIDAPGPRATLGSRTLMQVSIEPSGS